MSIGKGCSTSSTRRGMRGSYADSEKRELRGVQNFWKTSACLKGTPRGKWAT